MLIPQSQQFDIWSDKLTIPVLALDIVIFTIYKGELCILVTKRNEDNIHGYSLPGSIVAKGYSLSENFDEVLKRKTGITHGVYKEQLYTFGENSARDPRGHVIALAYYALVKAESLLSQVDFTLVDIVTVEQFMKLHIFYEHDEIFRYALKRLKDKLGYTDIVKNILSEEFRISEMQKMYEIILGRSLDKLNFQKKIFSLGIVTETGKKDTSTNRPAKLYRFVEKKQLKFIDML
ncbi:NUDIX hydrolase [Candidatus Gracilibacteria bacterium]|nr:NUDIX hydrolase [Candidatus Gracilibacteria bacterium]